jgi:hypothetical protein
MTGNAGGLEEVLYREKKRSRKRELGQWSRKAEEQKSDTKKAQL